MREETDIAANIISVRERIARAANRVGRGAEDITLIAVSKTRDAAQIQKAYRAGVRHFGENYVQEALVKLPLVQLSCPEATWHFIGHLQSNKVKDIVGRFTLIHSVDSAALAREIGRRSLQMQQSAALLLEVKLDTAGAKFGFAPETVLQAAEEVRRLPGVELRGMMGMAPFSETAEQARPFFRQLYGLFSQLPIREQAILSMGMTGDFEIAIEEGATHIRIGTAIFGKREE